MRILIAFLTTVTVAFVLLTIVGLTAGWADSVTLIRAHFIVGAAVVGVATGGVSAWVARTLTSAAVIAGIIMVACYAPFLPVSAQPLDATVQLLVALLAAGGAILLVTTRRRRDQ